MPNGDFESVTTTIIENDGVPNDTIDIPTDWAPFFSIFNALDPTVDLEISSVAPGATMSDSALFIGTISDPDLSEWDAFTTFPCDDQPDGISFDVKYEGTSADTLDLFVFLTKYDADNDTSIIVAGVSGVLAPPFADGFGSVTTNFIVLEPDIVPDSVTHHFYGLCGCCQ